MRLRPDNLKQLIVTLSLILPIAKQVNWQSLNTEQFPLRAGSREDAYVFKFNFTVIGAPLPWKRSVSFNISLVANLNLNLNWSGTAITINHCYTLTSLACLAFTPLCSQSPPVLNSTVALAFFLIKISIPKNIFSARVVLCDGRENCRFDGGQTGMSKNNLIDIKNFSLLVYLVKQTHLSVSKGTHRTLGVLTMRNRY